MKRWDQSDEDVLYQFYNKIPFIEICKMLPKYSQSQIRAKAYRLGITKSRGEEWSDDDVQIVKEWYSELGCSDELMNKLSKPRTESAVFAKAKELGIRTRELWTEEEI